METNLCRVIVLLLGDLFTDRMVQGEGLFQALKVQCIGYSTYYKLHSTCIHASRNLQNNQNKKVGWYTIEAVGVLILLW